MKATIHTNKVSCQSYLNNFMWLKTLSKHNVENVAGQKYKFWANVVSWLWQIFILWTFWYKNCKICNFCRENLPCECNFRTILIKYFNQQIAVWSAGQSELSPAPVRMISTGSETGQFILGPALLRTAEASSACSEAGSEVTVYDLPGISWHSESDRGSWSTPLARENLLSPSSTSITRLPASDVDGDPTGLESESIKMNWI